MLNATTLQKIGHKLYKKRVPILPKLIYQATFLIFNSSLPASAIIGKNTKCAYGGVGVVIQSEMEIGENVMIGQNVTLGGNFNAGRPKIGNNVYIGAGSRIISSTIGNNVVIGVNSVVSNKTIPDNMVIAGTPAKIIGEYNPDIHKWGINRDF